VAPDDAPGGVAVENADLTLTSSVIQANESDNAAGGLAAIDDARVDLSYCVVRANVSETQAGGIDVGEGAIVEMDNVRIVLNVVRSAGVGGMTTAFDSGATMTHCLIASNSGSSGGGGLRVEPGAAPVLTSSVIAGNLADGNGAGIQLQASSFPSLTNVTVAGNWSRYGATGGGLWLGSGASPTLINVIVWGNEAASGGGIASEGGQFQAYASTLYGNLPDDISGGSWPVGADGNLAADPLFGDTMSLDALDWDLHLGITSDLVDAGFAAYADPDGGAGDMGAFGGTGAGSWDLDEDGYPSWWQPGPYDTATYAPQGWDCDDMNPDVYPGSGC
jgi:parallel beta-helix repeat protein